MIPLLVVLLSGYAIGKLMPKGWPAYAICVPTSVAAYFITRIAFSTFLANGPEVPDIVFGILVGVFESPLAMLGAFLARRGSKRNTFIA